MNLLCPNCQKNLTIPDQNAGQLMKCPLCGGNFKAPALPSSMILTRSGPTAGPGALPAPPEVSAAPPPPPSVEVPPPHLGPEAPVPGTADRIAPQTVGPSPGLDAAGYRRMLGLRLNPHVLRWIPPAAYLFVLLLTFLPWVGLYPGNKPVYTENAWQAALGFGSSSEGELLQQMGLDKTSLDKEVTASAALIFYLIVLLITVVVVIAAAVVTVIRVPLPPAVQPLLRWRVALPAAVALFGFLLLVLQVALGLSLENVIAQRNQKQVEEQVVAARQQGLKAASESDYADMLRNLGLARYGIRRTGTYRLAVCLHFLGLLCLVLEFWLERRGEGQPLPEVVFRW